MPEHPEQAFNFESLIIKHLRNSTEIRKGIVVPILGG